MKLAKSQRILTRYLKVKDKGKQQVITVYYIQRNLELFPHWQERLGLAMLIDPSVQFNIYPCTNLRPNINFTYKIMS